MGYYIVTYQHSDGDQRKARVLASSNEDARQQLISAGYVVLAVQAPASDTKLAAKGARRI